MATGEAEAMYTAVDWTAPAALIVGNEAHGVGAEARSVVQSSISVPMANQTESLNAAMAAGIILFEAVRQKNRRP